MPLSHPPLKIYTFYSVTRRKHRHFAIFYLQLPGASVVTSGHDEDDMRPPRDLGLEAITVTEQDWVISPFRVGTHGLMRGVESGMSTE